MSDINSTPLLVSTIDGGAGTPGREVMPPRIGFGTFQQTDDEALVSSRAALSCGYRHIDTAQMYQNEGSVGRAVRECGAPRSDIWVTTKIWRDSYGFDPLLECISTRLRFLGLSYIDLMLLHCPPEPRERRRTWQAMEHAKREGMVREIGVSNFGLHHMKELLGFCKIPPLVNQIEVHPFCARPELVNYCQSHGVVVEAFSPLAKGRFMSDKTLCRIAGSHNHAQSQPSEPNFVTPAQVMLRWGLQKGLIVLPKSVHPNRIAENIRVFDFSLTQSDMIDLDSLDLEATTGWDPTTWP
ncbi:Aldo/keto reductase family protein [Pelomyxa schiedti]|nr:Aldo/keto reductase family protein [Pelomyxa schiedti]